MAFVTAIIHSFQYFVAYLQAAPVVGGLMFVILGIPIFCAHMLVWAAARFVNALWAAGVALVVNLLCALGGVLWPMQVPGSGPSMDWAVNAAMFVTIGLVTNTVLIRFTLRSKALLLR